MGRGDVEERQTAPAIAFCWRGAVARAQRPSMAAKSPNGLRQASSAKWAKWAPPAAGRRRRGGGTRALVPVLGVYGALPAARELRHARGGVRSRRTPPMLPGNRLGGLGRGARGRCRGGARGAYAARDWRHKEPLGRQDGPWLQL